MLAVGTYCYVVVCTLQARSGSAARREVPTEGGDGGHIVAAARLQLVTGRIAAKRQSAGIVFTQ